MNYNKNCGLSKQEFELEKIVGKIKEEKSTLKCICILKNLLDEQTERNRI